MAAARPIWSGLATVLGWRRLGFFIPHRYAGIVVAPAEGYPALTPLFDRARPAFAETLALVERHAPALRRIAATAPPPEPRWQQDWFPRADAAVAYAMVAGHRPQRLIEIGSGHSTRFFCRAARDEGLALQLTAIDPAPRADLGALPIDVRRVPLQQVPAATFAPLQSGDFLAIDSSHILMPGSDVDLLLNRVLPALPAGVFVHFHDMFLPDAYPAEWAWRHYNEQSAVGALMFGGSYRLLWSSRFATTRMADAVDRNVIGQLPLPIGAFESSLWLQKTSDAYL